MSTLESKKCHLILHTMLAATAALLFSPNTAFAGVTVSTLAGKVGVSGYLDAVGTAAELAGPEGIVLIGTDLYFVDGGSRTIRKVTTAGPAGTIGTVTTIAGDPTSPILPPTTYPTVIVNGTGTAAEFININGLGKDGAGNLYVSEYWPSVIRKVELGTATVTTLAGTGYSGYQNGAGNVAQFSYPVGVAGDSAGSFAYVADHRNGAIRKIDLSTKVVTTIAGPLPPGVGGFVNPLAGVPVPVLDARFAYPFGIVVDPYGSGEIFVADTYNHAIRKISGSDVITIAGAGPSVPFADPGGYADGPGATAEFNRPYGMDVDASGNLFVADRFNNTIRMLKPDAGGGATYTVSTIAGLGPSNGGFDNGDETQAKFKTPFDLAVTPDGCTIYVSDTQNQVIRKIERDCEVDLAIMKQVVAVANHDNGVQDTTFAIVVSGIGVGLNTGDQIHVTDQLPGGLIVKSYTAPGWTCSPSPVGTSVLNCTYTLGVFPPQPIQITVAHTTPFTNCASVEVKRNGVAIDETDLSNNASCVNKFGTLEIEKEIVASNPKTAATYAGFISQLNNTSNPTAYDVGIACTLPASPMSLYQTAALTVAGYVNTSMAAPSTCTIVEQPPTAPLPRSCRWLPPEYPNGNSGAISIGGILTITIRNTMDCPTLYNGGPSGPRALGSTKRRPSDDNVASPKKRKRD